MTTERMDEPAEQDALALLRADADGAIVWQSPAMAALLAGADVVAVAHVLDLLDPDHRGPFRHAFERAVAGACHTETVLVVAGPRAGRWFRVEASPLDALTGDDGVHLAMFDVTAEVAAQAQLREAEARLWHLAHHDALTGLANRELFRTRLAEAWARHRSDGSGVAVLLCDLDRFKEVNDAFGQEGGDAVLKACAERVLRCVRDSDTVARLGGDEFIVLCERFGGLDDVEAIAARIVAELGEPVLLYAGSALLTASIGICTTDQLHGSAEALLSRADHAVQQMKLAGRSGITVAGPSERAFEPPRGNVAGGPGGPGGPGGLEATRSVTDRVGEAVLVINPAGLITHLNAAAAELYGYAEQELIGRPVAELITEAHRDQFHADVARAALGSHLADVRTVRRRCDGSHVDVTSELFPVSVGNVPTPRSADALPAVGRLLVTAEELAATVDVLDGIVYRMDTEGRITFAGGRGLAALGLARDDLVGVSLTDIFDERWSPLLPTVLAGEPLDLPVDIGDQMWNALSRGVQDDHGNLVAIAGLLVPGQDSWDEHAAVARSEARFRALVQHSSDLFAVVRPDLRLEYVSPSARELLGWDPAGLNGQPVTNYLHPDDVGVGRRYFLERRHGGAPTTFDLRLRTADHQWRTYEFTLNDLLDDPSVEGVVFNGRDVTDRRMVDAEMLHRARHDDLTGLANRATLLERTDELLAAGSPDLGVVVLGLDRFRLVNDSMGHAAGDQLLRTVADRLRGAVRPTDIVARIGGDTFVMVLRHVGDDGTARAMAARLLACLDAPVEVGGRRISVHASIGVARSGGDAAALVQDADAAMHLAKQPGRGNVQLFDPSMRTRTAQRLDLEQALGTVVERGELRVHYQPIVALHDGVVPVGVEALVRWEHPELGLVPPLDFIPLAEETGHIVEIGAWVLREACRTVARWSAQGHPVHLSVNVSPRQLMADLPAMVADVLAETGLAPEQLTMEVTESVLVDEGPVATEALSAIRALGVRLAIDDFGTGYSSLLSLRRLHVDTLKVDRSFVDGLGQDAEDEAIVTTVIDLAHSLGLAVVAEGVETEGQRRHLQDRGCTLAQGWLFSRPLTEAAYVERFHGADRR